MRDTPALLKRSVELEEEIHTCVTINSTRCCGEGGCGRTWIGRVAVRVAQRSPDGKYIRDSSRAESIRVRHGRKKLLVLRKRQLGLKRALAISEA